MTEGIKNEGMTAVQMLEVWGLRSDGGSFKSPLTQGQGGRLGPDDELSLILYVESTPGFSAARVVLEQVHVLHRPIDRAMIQKPGETLDSAYQRLGWVGLDLFKRAKACEWVYRSFLLRLERRMIEQPWRKPARPREEQTAWEIGAVAAKNR